ncbi:MAG TPA: NAD(P)H-binding protein [Actinomycetota bacterium]|nr:NAD(P)H-binding protein [Actinomycetota bacterium]
MGGILVTGASGTIGGRLAQHLVDEGVEIRVAGRDPGRLTERWPGVDAVELDVMRPETIGPATEGVRTAYYLIHSMEEGGEPFEERDRLAATNFARGAAGSGVERIVFLGGLGDDEDPDLSPHLASRHETGRLLAGHGPAVLELRAGMVIGAGSASFRMLEDLVRRLPVMVTPRWVETRSQPIAIDDVVAYLDRAREVPLDGPHTIVEVGGADVLTYREMMRRLGVMRGRAPRILPVPVLTPWLSSLWCGLVTSVPTAVAKPLIEGQRNETIVRDDVAARLFPDVHPLGFDEAVRRARSEAARA